MAPAANIMELAISPDRTKRELSVMLHAPIKGVAKGENASSALSVVRVVVGAVKIPASVE
ncbi:hypothetical protein D3C76_1780220 [compost metagenome]